MKKSVQAKESKFSKLGKIREVFSTETGKRLEELRKKYERENKNPYYVAWEDFYYAMMGVNKDLALIKGILYALVPIIMSIIGMSIVAG